MFVIHGSSRQNGNTESLTHMMIDGIETEQIYLRDHIVHPITDQRHDAEGFQPVNDDYQAFNRAHARARHNYLRYTAILVRNEWSYEELR